MEKYLQSIKRHVRFRWVLLEEILDDIACDDNLKGETVTTVVKYALNHGWELYYDIDSGWLIFSN